MPPVAQRPEKDLLALVAKRLERYPRGALA
jgi:hypothetical protein